PAPPPGGTTAPDPTPGDQDLPWKATPDRRDLWGPVEKPLQGTGRSPASRAGGPARRSPLVRLGAPDAPGGLAALAARAVRLGTVAAAANRPLPAATARPVLDASVPDSTRTVLEKILTADATTGEQVARLRPQAGSTPTATSVLDHVEALLTRIDALVGAEQL